MPPESFPAVEFARQISLLDFESFSKIKANEVRFYSSILCPLVSSLAFDLLVTMITVCRSSRSCCFLSHHPSLTVAVAIGLSMGKERCGRALPESERKYSVLQPGNKRFHYVSSKLVL